MRQQGGVLARREGQHVADPPTKRRMEARQSAATRERLEEWLAEDGETREKEGRSHRGVAFAREKATKLFAFRLTPSDELRLRELKELTNASSLTEVILNALATYDLVVDKFVSGRSIAFLDKKEDGV